MGRFAKITMLAVAACVALAVSLINQSDAQGATQGAWEDLAGPVYSAEMIRAIEVEGVHLGMTRAQAAAALNARGYTLLVLEGDEGDTFRSADDRLSIGLSYAMDRRREVIDHILVSIFTFNDATFAARRDAILAALGEPTRLQRLTTDDGRSHATMRFVTDRALIDEVSLAGSCYGDWQCQTVVLHDDCRPPVRRVRSTVIDGGYSDSHLYVTIDDYAQRARRLLRDRAFRTQDTAGAICLIPSVH